MRFTFKTISNSFSFHNSLTKTKATLTSPRAQLHHESFKPTVTLLLGRNMHNFRQLSEAGQAIHSENV